MQDINLSRLRTHFLTHPPLVQNITNTVVQQFSANVLLAIGASPAMLDHEADAAQFVRIANALLINYGTASNQQFLAADVAIDAAMDNAKPWVLDPVSVGSIDFRSSKIRQSLARHPNVIRANASEVMALAHQGQGGRGVDAVDEVEEAIPAAISLAQQTGAVVAISGKVDMVVAAIDHYIQLARIEGGHELMNRVIGTGCALGSAVAAYLGTRINSSTEDDFIATIAAHAHFALAGSMAAKHAHAPGSFAAAFLDALYDIKPDDFADVIVSIETRPIHEHKHDA